VKVVSRLSAIVMAFGALGVLFLPTATPDTPVRPEASTAAQTRRVVKSRALDPAGSEVVYVGTDRLRRNESTQYAVCTLVVHDPHWSNKGRTAVFKSDVLCKGNMARIRVQVRTFLARARKDGSLNLVAGRLEDRSVVLNRVKPDRFYCPIPGVKVKTHGFYRGAATLTITEPGGVKTDPRTEQSHMAPVPFDFRY